MRQFESNHTKVSICVPAHNEGADIRKTLDQLKGYFPDAEIIVVDDGSTDDTEDAARQVEGVTVLSHERNIGYGAALKTAMRHASGEVIAWYDGDGQHRPADLEKVLVPVLQGSKDSVIGVRSRNSAQERDRIVGKLFLRTVCEVIAGQRIPDFNSGLRCFQSNVIKRYLHLLPDGFSASTTTTLLMLKRGYRVGHVSIVTRKPQSRSKVRIIRDGIATVKIMLRMLVLFNALKLFLLLSLIQLVPALLYGFLVAMTRGAGFSVLAGTVVVSGVMTLLIGIVCDQVTAFRQEKFED